MNKSEIKRISETLWEIPETYKPGMRVPARIYATEKLFDAMDDGVFEQVTNVATLPGIIKHSICMPDGHWGYGFPIGGVAAFDLEKGVISPGGIGFDINCGMRLMRTNLTVDDVKPHIKKLIDHLFGRVPAGVGSKGFMKISGKDFVNAVENGSEWCLDRGMATKDDLEKTENRGRMHSADSSKTSSRATDRGYEQIGTLGSGNHYLEIQVAKPKNIFDKELAAKFGFTLPNQIAIMFHCGSRGYGHQIATDYLDVFLGAMKKYGIEVPDRELACVPFDSKEGRDYFAAMNCAINMSYVNRQIIMHRVREVFSDVLKKSPEELGLDMVYDVSHNTAMIEKQVIDGKLREILVHRKGATRAFAPGNESLPAVYRETGQPVIIGGSMETGSYLLAGLPGADASFFSTAHGSGRTMSRHKAKKLYNGRELQEDLEKRGIYIRTTSYAGLAEEAGAAYKNIDDVVEATAISGITKPVIRFVPIGNIKG